MMVVLLEILPESGVARSEILTTTYNATTGDYLEDGVVRKGWTPSRLYEYLVVDKNSEELYFYDYISQTFIVLPISVYQVAKIQVTAKQ